MEEKIKLITSAEANKYLYRQIKQLLLPKGFIVRPGKTAYLVRLKGNHIQMVYQEKSHGETMLQRIAVPVWTCQDGWFFCERIYLKRTREPGVKRNLYSDAAFKQRASLKTYYDPAELTRIWEDAIAPQLQEEVIDFFEGMDFHAFTGLCENPRGDRYMHYGSFSPACAYFSAGYSHLLIRQYEKGEEYIRKAIAESREKIAGAEPYGGLSDPMYARDMDRGIEILEILEKREPGYQDILENRLALLKREALEHNYQITLSDKGETVKLKKERRPEGTL